MAPEGGEGLGSIFVGVLAVVVSAIFNVATLRRSGRQFQQGRIDARNDKLRAEIAAFNVALGERKSQLDVFVYRVQGLAESFSLDDSPSPSEFEQTARAALLVVDVYRQISSHAFAINMLTDDRAITARVNRMQHEISADRQEIEATLQLLNRAAPSEVHIEDLKQRQAGRRELLEREQAELVDYCLTKWAPLTR
jgi:hypothetical protein